jgi:hypothetical protein
MDAHERKGRCGHQTSTGSVDPRRVIAESFQVSHRRTRTFRHAISGGKEKIVEARDRRRRRFGGPDGAFG